MRQNREHVRKRTNVSLEALWSDPEGSQRGGWWQRKSESLRWVDCIVLAAALPLYPAGWVERRKKNCVMMEECGSHIGAGNRWGRAGRWPSWMQGSNFSRGVLLRVMRTLLPDKLITAFGKAQTEPSRVVTHCGGWITLSHRALDFPVFLTKCFYLLLTFETFFFK